MLQDDVVKATVLKITSGLENGFTAGYVFDESFRIGRAVLFGQFVYGSICR